MHRGAFYQFPFRWIYYCHISTRKETGKTHLSAVCWGWMLLEKRWLISYFKFKNFSIKQVIFIIEIISMRVKVHTQKKIWRFFSLIFKNFCSFKHFFQNLKCLKHNKSNFFYFNHLAVKCFAHTWKAQKFSLKNLQNVEIWYVEFQKYFEPIVPPSLARLEETMQLISLPTLFATKIRWIVNKIKLFEKLVY